MCSDAELSGASDFGTVGESALLCCKVVPDKEIACC